MPINLPLDRMTLAEKLEAMEALWADLSRRPSDLPTPDWHKQVLEERRQQAAEGKIEFLYWDETMADLRKELRGDPPA